MSTATWIPETVPPDKPNASRIYDYLLGGYHNFEIDRLAGDRVVEIYPDSRLSSQACRAFLRRVVNYLTEQGIDQFLDIGSGIPTVGNVHEVAQQAIPDASVVYVDIDPTAVAHSRAILKDNPNATALQGDARWPDKILSHTEIKRLLDFDRPVAVLLLLVLHTIASDEEAYGAVRTVRDALAPGSYVAISHGTRDNAPPGVMDQLQKLSAGTPTPTIDRTRAEIERFFEGLELVKPGVVRPPLWRPEGPDDVLLDQPERVLVFAGVGRKPEANDAST